MHWIEMLDQALMNSPAGLVDTTSRELLVAQRKAEALFAQVVERGLVSAGKLESELTAEIHALAQSLFGVRRHWHKRIARSGPNTLLTYHDGDTDRRIAPDDIVYLDFGPVFEDWEADFGRTYVVGSDPDKHRLVRDLGDAFARGKNYYRQSPESYGRRAVRLHRRPRGGLRLGVRRAYRGTFDRPFPARDVDRRIPID